MKQLVQNSIACLKMPPWSMLSFLPRHSLRVLKAWREEDLQQREEEGQNTDLLLVTPVGSQDPHNLAFYFVGYKQWGKWGGVASGQVLSDIQQAEKPSLKDLRCYCRRSVIIWASCHIYPDTNRDYYMGEKWDWHRYKSSCHAKTWCFINRAIFFLGLQARSGFYII